MDKVIVAYWSQTGNTAAMAAAIGEGITEAGKEAVVTDISSVSMDDLQAASAFALGCPAMGAEVLEEGEMEPFVTEVEAFAAGKKIGLFGSYGWGDGQWMRDWEDRMKAAGAAIVGREGVICQETPDDEALENCKVKKYVTDFANETVAGREGILVTPHLGASTEESEENCAEMAVKELRDYLENGNIKNSVNYPNCDMGTCVAVGRIALAHSNIPNMISQVTKILGSEGLNIADMTNKSKGEFAYTLIDLESTASAKALDELKAIEGMYRVRVVK